MTDASILEERVDGLGHTFRVRIDAGSIDSAVEKRLQDLRHAARVPGFRAGRAPLSLLRNRYGRQLRAATVDHLAIGVARKLIAERELKPSRRPKIEFDDEQSAPAGSAHFTLLLEVIPAVALGRLGDYSLRYLKVTGEDAETAEQANEYLRRQLFDALLASHDVPVPDQMVQEEYKRIARGFEAEVGESVNPELEIDLRRIATRRIRLAILLTEIGRAHGISVSRAEVASLVERQAERDVDHKKEIIDWYLDHPTALAELQLPLFESRVVDFLLTRSTVDVVEVTPEEFMRAMDAL